MYIQYLREMIPPPSQNTVGVCNQNTLLTPYCIDCSLLTLLKVIDAPINSLVFFFLLFILSLLPLAFIYSFFFPVMSTSFTSHIVQIICVTLVLSCNHCAVACYPWFKKRKHSFSNHGLCCFDSYRLRLCLAEVLVFSLMFSEALFMSSLSSRFSKAANLFEILIWYCFLTSSWLSLLRFSLSHKTSVLLVYLLPVFS